ncbi:MAG TPA: zinc metallopeptidase [Bacillota bacterium]|nr:zinc metallopeptidase [Bacillota bacterium]
MWYDSTFLLLIPAMLIALRAQARVSSALGRWKMVRSASGLTGAQTARRLLDSNGLTDVAVEQINSDMGDQYDPSKKVVRLSPEIYGSASVAALSVAAHETGHALQHAQGYAFLSARTAVFPLARFGSNAAFPLLIIGLLFSFNALINIGIVLFSFAVLFQLITLPVEFNASSRAKVMLKEQGLVDAHEQSGVDEVLNAAALTYVAAAFTAIMQLLRLLLLSRNRRR